MELQKLSNEQNNFIENAKSFTLGAAVLAGGRSSRMGCNKVLLEYQNRRFLDRILGELSCFDEVLLSAPAQGLYHGEYDELGVPIVQDEQADVGPMEGIRQVLLHATSDYVFVCAGDMPFVTAGLIRYMGEFLCSDYDCYCMVDENHIHPLCAIYSKKALPVVEALIAEGRYRLFEIFKALPTKYIRISDSSQDAKQLRNVNTREEYQKLLLPIVFCVSGIKDSGKTFLIERLINEFIHEGYSVGVIKHDGHEFVMDYEGTDTKRFLTAGAGCSIIFSESRVAIQRKETADPASLLKECEGMDVIIFEGLKASDYPKVEVVRGAVSDAPVCDPKTFIAIASDCVQQAAVDCPVYDIDDVAALYACIKKYFGLLEEV